MKNLQINRFMLSFLVVFAAFLCTNGQVKRTDSKIESVVLYKNYALLNTVSNINLQEGVQDIYIDKIANGLIDNTLQILTDGDVTILGTKTNKVFAKNNTPVLVMKSINDSIIIFQNKNKVLEYSQLALNGERDLLKENYFTGSSSIGATPEKTKAMADFYRMRIAEINKQSFENDQNIAQNKKMIDWLEQRKNALNIEDLNYNNQLQLTVQSAKSQNLNFYCEYLVSGCGWNNFYELKGTGQKEPLQVINKAIVYQNSGIDWLNVKLSLSNANPFQNNQKPVLMPHYLQEIVRYSSQPVMYESVVSGYGARDDVRRKEVKQAHAVIPVQKSNNDLEQLFAIEKPYTILNGGSQQMLTIEAQNIPAQFAFELYPRYNDKAYLMANINDWSQYKLESGQISTFWIGRKLGQSYLNLNETADTLIVPMGMDKSINCKRETILSAKDKKVISGQVKEKVSYKITIKNQKSEAVDVIVKDQIPVQNSENMTIIDKNVGGANLEKETGFLTWNLKLAANETKVLTFWYEIKYPKNNRPALP